MCDLASALEAEGMVHHTTGNVPESPNNFTSNCSLNNYLTLTVRWFWTCKELSAQIWSRFTNLNVVYNFGILVFKGQHQLNIY